METSGNLHAMTAAGSLIHIEYEDGWAKDPIWKFWRWEKSCVPVRIWTLDCPVYSLVTVLTTLPQFTMLHYIYIHTYTLSILNTYVQTNHILQYSYRKR